MGKVVGALYGGVGDRVDCVHAPSAFESAPTDPTMAVTVNLAGPVLQVGEASGAALSAQDMALPGR